ncbi:MAG: preprotein translocase subunit SecA [Holosporales bacterium]|jgi:preprotein translocase subunit SecA|nr:preprotein translocase subunit SecA [Holosporales bacterium]
MFSSLFALFGSYNSRIVKSYEKIVDKINAFEAEMQSLSDKELANKTPEFKKSLASGKTLDSILPQAFAVVRETSKRILGMRHFDVQLIGGVALHNGQIAEMKTGEGKTLVATLAVYLNALAGKGVHVITVNDYLAQRDAAWMGKIYKFLGLSVSTIVGNMGDLTKKRAYSADITYGTNHEFGFDYLRDNLRFDERELVMRPFNFAVIDEVDSILIDEARTPLIISGGDDGASNLYVAVDSVIKKLTDEDFEKDNKNKVVTLTEKGVEKAELELTKIGLLKIPELYDPSNISIVYHVNCALKANKLFIHDVDYIVKDGRVLIIDEFTGRIMDGRRYSEGLHQAIEAKEGVEVLTESQTIATISYQNLFRLYPKLAGMTGTAMTEEAEFDEIYKLKVVSIPSHKPVMRKDHEDSMFVTLAEKDRAVLALVKECHSRRQPILVGTTSLERSEHFSKLLSTERLKHNVLNAKQHEREAYIIAEAGAPGAITIATNMAGRGTDIKLGGSLEMRVEQECSDISDPAEREKIIERISSEIERDHEAVVKSGGLFVVGTERNDSRRIDNQLRGRSGRQGDPGESKYFISLEDDLMKKFGSPNLIDRFRKVCKDDEELSFRWISKAIEKAQQRVEAYNFDIRKQLLRFDDVMNDQRKMIYEMRKTLMNPVDILSQIKDITDDVLEGIITANTSTQGGGAIGWNLHELTDSVKKIFKIDLSSENISDNPAITADALLQILTEQVDSNHNLKIEKYGKEFMQYIEKDIFLKVLDRAWKSHLLSLEHLRRGINLRSYAQKNPLNEYKFEAFSIFQDMIYGVKVNVLTALFNFKADDKLENILPDSTDEEFLDSPEPEEESKKSSEPFEETHDSFEDPYLFEEAQKDEILDIESSSEVFSRNAFCPCGSGKRYKHCCGALLPLFSSEPIHGSSKREVERPSRKKTAKKQKKKAEKKIKNMSKNQTENRAKRLPQNKKRTQPSSTRNSKDPAKMLHDFMKEQRKEILSDDPER